MSYCEVCGKPISSGTVCNSTACKLELEEMEKEESVKTFQKIQKPKKLEK